MKTSRKAWLALLLALALLLPMLPVRADEAQPADAALQTETAPEQSGEAAVRLPDEAHARYINGDQNGAFRPKDSLTRAELATIIYNLGSYPKGSTAFTDVKPTAWYAEAIYALAAQGILQGFSDGSFRPQSAVTRAQVVTILQRLSGEAAPEEVTTFPDVADTFWAYGAICLAQSKGWVKGYEDGSFRPNRAVTRAEIVTILNRYLGRVPDRAAIDADPNLRFFPDVAKTSWYYYDVMEASVTHRAHYDETEHWVSAETYVSEHPDGFYCINNRVYLQKNGAFLHTAVSGEFDGVPYAVAADTGICTIWSQVIRLANGELVFLKGSRPEALPGKYETGFYVRNGQLYVVQSGKILHTKQSGTLSGVSYTCTGESGVCTSPDWTKLPLKGVDLSVFTGKVPAKPSCSFTDVEKSAWYYSAVAIVEQLGLMGAASGSSFQPKTNVTYRQLLEAAIAVYESYFRVSDQPARSGDAALLQLARRYEIVQSESLSLDAAVTRGDVVLYLYRALRGRELTAKNEVDAIPDVPTSNKYYACTMAFYRAGILQGMDDAGSAKLSRNVTRAELAAMLTRLVLPSERLSFWMGAKTIKTLTYGVSGSGKYQLNAYQFGTGPNVMVLTYVMHGWEDNWDRDGQELMYLADQMRTFLEKNYETIKNGDWTVYVLRCCNPDGMLLGTTNNGPGRCTTTYYDAGGNLSTAHGIDMNRCFPYNFVVRTNDRNFNGTEPLGCREAQALADFVQQVKGSGRNICIDTHGWLSQIITSSGQGGAIYKAFYRRFPNNSFNSLLGGSGYFTSWTAYRVGYDSCLFEMPSDVMSHNDFVNSGYIERYQAAILELLTSYRDLPQQTLPETDESAPVEDLGGN